MTNGDRIRNMTDEEITAFLMSYESKVCAHCKYDDDIGCNFGDDGEVVCDKSYVHSVFMEWLSEETVSERSENQGVNKVNAKQDTEITKEDLIRASMIAFNLYVEFYKSISRPNEEPGKDKN